MHHHTEYARLLLVDSEAAPNDPKFEVLRHRHFDCDQVYSAHEALQKISTNHYDLVVTAMYLRDRDATYLCQSIRRSFNIPIVVYGQGAYSDPIDEVACLESGADDFISDFTQVSVLIARVRARLRNHKLQKRAPRLGHALGDLVLDQEKIQVFHNERPLGLTPTEMKLLKIFAVSPNSTVSRERILEQVWDTSYLGDKRVIDNHIRNLRRKLEVAGSRVVIHSVRGVGYKLALEDLRRRALTPA